MKESTIKLFILAVLMVLASFAIGHVHGYQQCKRRAGGSVTDTTWITKTKWETAPSHDYERLVSWTPYKFVTMPSDTTIRLDSVYVPSFIHDTLYLPITQKYYERLDGRLRLWVSGYQPQLDKWELDDLTAVVSKRKRLNFSVGTGVGVIYTPFHSVPVDAGVGVFGGITYSF